MLIKTNNNGANTLKKAAIIGLLGATISGIVAHTGSCTTMYIDFSRSLIEGLMTVISCIVFSKIQNNNTAQQRKILIQERIRIITGIVMIFTSMLLATVSIASFSPAQKEGNNIPSLVTTSICVFINLSILRNYKNSLRKDFNHIIKAQYTMYRSKTIINTFVLSILMLLTFFPTWNAINYLDLVGTIIMSIFIFTEGLKNIAIIKFPAINIKLSSKYNM